MRSIGCKSGLDKISPESGNRRISASSRLEGARRRKPRAISLKRRRAFRLCFDRRESATERRCFRPDQTRGRLSRKTVQRRGLVQPFPPYSRGCPALVPPFFGGTRAGIFFPTQAEPRGDWHASNSRPFAKYAKRTGHPHGSGVSERLGPAAGMFQIGKRSSAQPLCP